ncbi:ser/thr/tyr protein kinase RAD53, partial [Phenoliferia sp. Uapishka_3]
MSNANAEEDDDDGESYSQQQTQTQQQTQPQTQPLNSQPSPSWPSNLWGLLVSTSASPTLAELSRRDKENTPATTTDEEYIERPARVEMVVGKWEIRVGRNPKSDLCLNGKKISSNQARIWIDESGEEEGVRLEDTSTNGTFVRGRKVGKGKITLLESGDEIIFGPATTSFTNDFRYIFQGPHGSKSSSNSNQPWGIAESSGGGIHEKYDVREQIGKGSFATVRKGIRRSDGKMMAIKIIMKARFSANLKTMEMIGREVEIMKALDHKYCVRYIDYFEDEQRMWLVMEYVDGGDLLDYVMKRSGLSESETREIALMVCEAVAYLHSKGIAHRDIKPENLLLTRGARPIAKVTDFGLAKMVDTNTMLRTACGTPSYLAPEVILKEAHAGYGTQVDSWSIGVVLYSCMTNATPFDESESTPLPQRMQERYVDFSNLNMDYGISDIGIDFLRRLLIINPAERMSASDALKHPWLATGAEELGTSNSLPLHVSTLPYNDPNTSSSKEARTTNGNGNSVPFGMENTPSLTSAAISPDESFEYSQQLDKLRLGTLARSMDTASCTTPDRQDMDDSESHDLSTDAGTIGLPTPVVAQTEFDPQSTRRMSTSGDSPIKATKRKEPASAFSSASDLDEVEGSGMSLDGFTTRDLAREEWEKRGSVELNEEVDENGEEEEVKGGRGGRRRATSAAAAREATPRRKSVATRGATPAAEMVLREDGSPDSLAQIDTGLPGPTTRRRAKVARLS